MAFIPQSCCHLEGGMRAAPHSQSMLDTNGAARSVTNTTLRSVLVWFPATTICEELQPITNAYTFRTKKISAKKRYNQPKNITNSWREQGWTFRANKGSGLAEHIQNVNTDTDRHTAPVTWSGRRQVDALQYRATAIKITPTATEIRDQNVCLSSSNSKIYKT